MGQRRLVYSSIANQPINWFGHLILLEIIAKFMHTIEGVQFALHDVKVVHVEPTDFGHGFHFVYVANGSDHMVLVTGEEILDGLATESGGAAGDDDQFLITEAIFCLSNFHLLFVGQNFGSLQFGHEFEGIDAANGSECEK